VIGFIELFVPSAGVLTMMAVFALGGSVVFAFMQSFAFGCTFLGAVVIGVPVLVWYAIQLWPSTPIGRRIMLDPDEDPALQPNEEIERLKSLAGKSGIAKSRMMPAGLVEIEGRRYDALSEGQPIDAQTEVVVVHVQGINIVVRPKRDDIPDDVSGETQTIPDSSAPPNEPQIEDPFAERKQEHFLRGQEFILAVDRRSTLERLVLCKN